MGREPPGSAGGPFRSREARVRRFIKSIGCLIAATIVFTGCAEKVRKEISPVIYARERQYGYVYKLNVSSSMQPEEGEKFLNDLLGKFRDYYQTKTVQLSAEPGELDFQKVLFDGAAAGVDDVLVIEGQLGPGSFNGGVRILNTTAGQAVFNEAVQGGSAEGVWSTLEGKLKASYGDPNVNPSYDAVAIARRYEDRAALKLKFADGRIEKTLPTVGLFKTMEKGEKDRIARELSRARSMMQKILTEYERGIRRVLGSSDTTLIGYTRQEVDRVSRILDFYEEEIADAESRFALSFEYTNLTPQFQVYFQEAAKQIALEDTLKLYTKKPVKLNVIYDAQNDVGTVYLQLQLNQAGYLEFLKTKSPMFNDTRVLRLEMFNKVMGKLVQYRTALVQVAPPANRGVLEKFSVALELSRPRIGYVQIPILVQDGRLVTPNDLRVKLCNFDPILVQSAKPEFTKRENLFALGPGQDPTGARLPFGNIYEFFQMADYYGIELRPACDDNSSEVPQIVPE